MDETTIVVVSAVVLGATQFVKKLWDNPMKENLRMLSFALVASVVGVAAASRFYVLDLDVAIEAIVASLAVVGGYSLPKDWFKAKPKK